MQRKDENPLTINNMVSKQTFKTSLKRKIQRLLSWRNHGKMRQNPYEIQALDTVPEDDNNFVKDGHNLKTSVSDELKKSLNEDGVKQITDTISGVRFSKGAGREKYDGRIDGYDGEWKLFDTINVKDKIKFPIIVGCIDECDVIITDNMLGGLLGSCHTYILDMNTKHTRRVITSSVTSRVYSCALLNDDQVVCGKCSGGCIGDSLTGYISVYDRQWKHINDITIPRHTTCNFAWVDVAVDQDGMIIAAEYGQSKIYVINPADGKIMNTITCEENRLQGVLSSGRIIAQPSEPDHRVLIVDRQGFQREIPHSDVILNTCIDPKTDDLYVVTSGDEYTTCVIDQVMSGSDIKRGRVASFPLPPITYTLYERKGHLAASRVMMTSSGNMIACDGENILVFKRVLSL